MGTSRRAGHPRSDGLQLDPGDGAGARVIDLGHEWQARRRDPSLTPVWELHRLYAVTPLRELLEARGIPVTLRGLQHRRLLYVFGPFVPVELLVPAARAAEAEALIAGWSGLEAVGEVADEVAGVPPPPV
jgi:hypothetical protein